MNEEARRQRLLGQKEQSTYEFEGKSPAEVNTTLRLKRLTLAPSDESKCSAYSEDLKCPQTHKTAQKKFQKLHPDKNIGCKELATWMTGMYGRDCYGLEGDTVKWDKNDKTWRNPNFPNFYTLPVPSGATTKSTTPTAGQSSVSSSNLPAHCKGKPAKKVIGRFCKAEHLSSEMRNQCECLPGTQQHIKAIQPKALTLMDQPRPATTTPIGCNQFNDESGVLAGSKAEGKCESTKGCFSQKQRDGKKKCRGVTRRKGRKKKKNGKKKKKKTRKICMKHSECLDNQKCDIPNNTCISLDPDEKRTGELLGPNPGALLRKSASRARAFAPSSKISKKSSKWGTIQKQIPKKKIPGGLSATELASATMMESYAGKKSAEPLVTDVKHETGSKWTQGTVTSGFWKGQKFAYNNTKKEYIIWSQHATQINCDPCVWRIYPSMKSDIDQAKKGFTRVPGTIWYFNTKTNTWHKTLPDGITFDNTQLEQISEKLYGSKKEIVMLLKVQQKLRKKIKARRQAKALTDTGGKSDKPVCLEQQSGPLYDPETGKAIDPNDTNASCQRPPPLPAGWIIGFDADGRAYYYTADGQNQWNRPTAPHVQVPTTTHEDGGGMKKGDDPSDALPISSLASQSIQAKKWKSRAQWGTAFNAFMNPKQNNFKKVYDDSVSSSAPNLDQIIAYFTK